MTSDPLDRATSMLKDAVADVGDVDALPAGRDVAVARLADALRTRARLQRRKRAIYTVAVAAGVALVAFGAIGVARHAGSVASAGAGTGAPGAPDLGRVEDPRGVTVVRDGHTEAIGGGARVAEGTELRTSPSSEARLDFDSGTRVIIGGSARVRLVEQSQRKRFSLEAGSLFAKVAKLGADERFVVATPDAEVEVRGTAFRVTIVPADRACEDGSPTRLDVAEGVVVVRHGGVEHRVAAGQHWPGCGTPASASASALALGTAGAAKPSPASGSAFTATPSGGVPVIPVGALPASTAPAQPPSTSTLTAAARGEGPGSLSAPSTPSAPEASSRLAEQNDLFDDAMRLKRSGDPTGAVAKLDRLLSLYPSGPLSESASAERMRLLASTDRARAAVAARDYLRRHPRGFARAEAESIAASAP
jgi:ferric-dicitrate binding protein FerR (iron transport regulator)